MDKKSNKIIHYCWFGGNPLSELTKKCIETWKKFLPDFEIKEWNEKNFDVNQCTFVKEAYEQKKWAFVADYCRFKVLEEHGGLYLDTDMEITADVSKYLEHTLFFGCEDSKMINAAVVWASDAQNKDIVEIVKFYESMEKFNPTGDLYEMSVPRVLTSYFQKYGFNKELEQVQVLDNGNVYIYPMEYFYPLSYDYQHNKFTDNSCMIHHFDATWISKMELFKTKMKRKNMKWVVYVIDFFINVKNKFKFFCNAGNISIFVVMFTILLLSMFSYTPINVSENVLDIFKSLKENLSNSIWQIVIISLVWSFICAKVRDISLNAFCDKITKVTSDTDEAKRRVLSQEEVVKVKKRDGYILISQIIITILLSIFPIFGVISIIPSSSVIYGVLIAIIMYYIYLGIRKDFKYRILELVPFGILFAIIEIFFTGQGVIMATVCAILILCMLLKNKITKKRILSFVLSFIIATLGLLGIKMISKNVDNDNQFGFKVNFVNFDRVNTYDEFKCDEIYTEFNAGKEFFGNNLENGITKKSISFIPVIFAYISLLIIAITTIINKKSNYILMMIPLILGMINLINISITSYAFMFYFVLAMLIMILVTHIFDMILNKD